MSTYLSRNDIESLEREEMREHGEITMKLGKLDFNHGGHKTLENSRFKTGVSTAISKAGVHSDFFKTSSDT